jgi:hypothetical protein
VSEKKKQHYVPRFLLRNFSADGRSIALIVLRSGKRIAQASLADQCFRNFFYGEDLVLENEFAEWESKIAGLLRHADIPHLQRLNPKELHQLKLFVHYQKLRTAGAADDLNMAADAIGRAVMSNGPDPLLKDLAGSVRIRHSSAQHLALYHAATSTPLLLDLEVKFLTRGRPPGFIISDDPVVMCNQWAENHPKFRGCAAITGLALKGIQMFLPLSPEICLTLFDPGTYTYGNASSVARRIDEADVHLLNGLQARNAVDCVYYQPGWSLAGDLTSLCEQRSKSGAARQPSVEVGGLSPHADGSLRQRMEYRPPGLRVGAKFGFVTGVDPETFENVPASNPPVRSLELIQLAQEYEAFIRRDASNATPAGRPRGPEDR